MYHPHASKSSGVLTTQCAERKGVCLRAYNSIDYVFPFHQIYVCTSSSRLDYDMTPRAMGRQMYGRATRIGTAFCDMITSGLCVDGCDASISTLPGFYCHPALIHILTRTSVSCERCLRVSGLSPPDLRMIAPNLILNIHATEGFQKVVHR